MLKKTVQVNIDGKNHYVDLIATRVSYYSFTWKDWLNLDPDIDSLVGKDYHLVFPLPKPKHTFGLFGGGQHSKEVLDLARNSISRFLKQSAVKYSGIMFGADVFHDAIKTGPVEVGSAQLIDTGLSHVYIEGYQDAFTIPVFFPGDYYVTGSVKHIATALKYGHAFTEWQPVSFAVCHDNVANWSLIK